MKATKQKFYKWNCFILWSVLTSSKTASCGSKIFIHKSSTASFNNCWFFSYGLFGLCLFPQLFQNTSILASFNFLISFPYIARFPLRINSRYSHSRKVSDWYTFFTWLPCDRKHVIVIMWSTTCMINPIQLTIIPRINKNHNRIRTYWYTLLFEISHTTL